MCPIFYQPSNILWNENIADITFWVKRHPVAECMTWAFPRYGKLMVNNRLIAFVATGTVRVPKTFHTTQVLSMTNLKTATNIDFELRGKEGELRLKDVPMIIVRRRVNELVSIHISPSHLQFGRKNSCVLASLSILQLRKLDFLIEDSSWGFCFFT
ncbi:hypothetical protein Nepgr_009997 [Nepenthes gracilis]|uniref:Uncharacterized protein n=1 Tax=Nepenthes gracilis TaxID=150966 RepID=A0AAD3XKN3_NEPGR|nr:hypothetical protein Nepgr_009997 [Nepenthes gracilis]